MSARSVDSARAEAADSRAAHRRERTLRLLCERTPGRYGPRLVPRIDRELCRPTGIANSLDLALGRAFRLLRFHGERKIDPAEVRREIRLEFTSMVEFVRDRRVLRWQPHRQTVDSLRLAG